MNMLHVPTITKNLVSVEQIFDQEMQVGSPTLRASSRKKSKSSRKGVGEGGCSSSTQMMSEPHCLRKDRKSSRISTYGRSGCPRQLLEAIELQPKQMVFGLPKFTGRKAKICEASQLGKQHRLPFPQRVNLKSEQDRLDTFGCMGTDTECIKSWRESIFCLFHRQLQLAHMDLPHRKEA